MPSNYGLPGNRYGPPPGPGRRLGPRRFVPPHRRSINPRKGRPMPGATPGSTAPKPPPGPPATHTIDKSQYGRLSMLNPFGGSSIAANDPARAALGNRRVFMASQRIQNPERLRKRLKELMARQKAQKPA